MANPTAAKLGALRSLLRARTTLTDRLETALRGDDLPPVAWYDVLCALDETSAEGLRPRDLGYAVALTPSGLTRLLDRMEAAGLVERKACPTDRRGYGVSLTASGKRTHKLMQPVYLQAVTEAFAELLTDAEARQLTEILDRVSASACSAAGEEPPAPAVKAA